MFVFAVYYLHKCLVWAATLGFGKLGAVFAPFFVMFSAAMTGGGMITRSVCIFICVWVFLRVSMCLHTTVVC